MDQLQSNAPRILFADDDQATLEIMRFWSNDNGYEAEFAHSAQEVIDNVNHNCENGGRCFDLLVLDINYDSDTMTGTAVARQIRKVYPDLPIIFVSGYNNTLTRAEVRRIGNTEALSKPTDAEELFELIKATIKRSKATILPTDESHKNERPLIALPKALDEAIKQVQKDQGATYDATNKEAFSSGHS